MAANALCSAPTSLSEPADLIRFQVRTIITPELMPLLARSIVSTLLSVTPAKRGELEAVLVECIMEQAMRASSLAGMYADLCVEVALGCRPADAPKADSPSSARKPAAASIPTMLTRQSSLPHMFQTPFVVLLCDALQVKFELGYRQAIDPQDQSKLPADATSVIARADARDEFSACAVFIGALFLRALLHVRIMMVCIDMLSAKGQWDALSKLCQQIGRHMDRITPNLPRPIYLTQWNGLFVQMEQWLANSKPDDPSYSVISDLMELRKRGWPASLRKPFSGGTAAWVPPAADFFLNHWQVIDQNDRRLLQQLRHSNDEKAFFDPRFGKIKPNPFREEPGTDSPDHTLDALRVLMRISEKTRPAWMP